MDIAFDKLTRLQQVDSEITRLVSLFEAIPIRLEAIDRQIQTTAEIVVQAKDKLAANQKKRREAESEIKVIRETIAKYKRQQNDVKSNKENDAIKKEISETQAKIDSIEESILNDMIGADDIEKEIRSAQTRQMEQEQTLRTEKDAIAAEKADIEKQKAANEVERAALLPRIPPEQVRLYHRIQQKKGGVALSEVTDDFCSLCQMRVRPQLLDELIARKSIVLCEACGRILTWMKPGPEDIPEEKSDDPDRKDDSASQND